MIDLYQARARDLMSANLIGISPGASLQEAAEMMSERSIHCLIVALNEPGRGLGIVTAKDIIQLLGEVEPRMLEEIRISDVATHPAVSVPEDLCVQDCINLMLMTGVRRLIVLRQSTPVGLLSHTDVIRAVAG